MKLSILIPTDFSNNAKSAINYAIKLYQEQECTFYLLHAWSVKTNNRTYITSNFVDTSKEEAKIKLKDFKNNIESLNANKKHTFKTIFSTNKLIDAINCNLKDFSIDQLFMGTKGVTKAKEQWFGSNTVNTIKKINQCPIIVVPDEYNFKPLKQIAFATDYNRHFGDELITIKAFVKLYDSKLQVVHVCKKNTLTDNQNHNLTMLQANLSDIPHNFNWMTDELKKTEEITNFIKLQDIDALILINYNHGFIENLINEPVIKNVVSYPDVPLLILPYKD
ncbi:universal stress protein [Olleya sp. YSTF-M6]|uniref:Universal stress protein n=1 Tax=Olleya sediminilitoris TaxID=2795739 RepID=A0ABS1WPX2_9FLAO|nr:universal stress protein [Olleya sediminilitoris]MBL7561148.1 universal stress protein [Olleya sediminilitoris]